MSTEILRRAATLMRERAYGATSGPWAVAVVVSPQHGDTEQPEWGQTEDAEHIAAFSPEVADLLAVWLDSHADVHSAYECEENEPCPAVEFARAYVGSAA